MDGYAGAVLTVDLSDGRITKEPLRDDLVQDYIGGEGFGARLLLGLRYRLIHHPEMAHFDQRAKCPPKQRFFTFQLRNRTEFQPISESSPPSKTPLPAS